MNNVTNEQILDMTNRLSKQIEAINERTAFDIKRFNERTAFEIKRLNERLSHQMDDIDQIKSILENVHREEVINNLVYMTSRSSEQIKDINEMMISGAKSFNERLNKHSEGFKHIVSILENELKDRMRDPSVDDQPDGGLR